MTILRFAAFALCTAALAVPANTQTIQVSKENRTIAITASAKVLAMADTATVHIGFIAYGPNTDSTYANGSHISNSIINALTSAGIPNEAIEMKSEHLPRPGVSNR